MSCTVVQCHGAPVIAALVDVLFAGGVSMSCTEVQCHGARPMSREWCHDAICVGALGESGYDCWRFRARGSQCLAVFEQGEVQQPATGVLRPPHARADCAVEQLVPGGVQHRRCCSEATLVGAAGTVWWRAESTGIDGCSDCVHHIKYW